MRVPLAALLAAAAILAAQARADDGGSGTYAASGSSYQVALVNSGTTAWQFFTLTAPSGTAFVGGATQGESTARCVAGQPDGLPNELECGPVTVGPGGRVGVVATVTGTASCGGALHLAVSSTGTPPFSQATDVVPSASCGGPATPTPASGGCVTVSEQAADAATVAELGAEEQALAFEWSEAAKRLAEAQHALATRPRSPSVAAALRAVASARAAVARVAALAPVVSGRRTTAGTLLAAAKASATCQASRFECPPSAASRARLAVFNAAAGDIGHTRIATTSTVLTKAVTPGAPPALRGAAASVRAGAARLAGFLRKRPGRAIC